MEFMDKVTEISKKVGDGVADTYKSVVDKSGKLLEEAKLKIAISDKESNIEQIFISMGRTVYDMYSKGEDVGKIFSKECKNVDKITTEIDEINKIILYNKNLRKCLNCFEIIALDSSYCENCGDKQKPVKIKKAAEKEESKKEDTSDIVCPTCGHLSSDKTKFCQKCGYKF